MFTEEKCERKSSKLCSWSIQPQTYEKKWTQYLVYKTQAGATENFEFWKVRLPSLTLVEMFELTLQCIVVSNATDYIGLLTTIHCSANSNIFLKRISKWFVVCCDQ